MAGFFASGETHRPAFPDRPLPEITYGLRFDEACARHVRRLGCSRAYIIASKSLSSNTDALERLQKALGPLVAGTRVGISSHTPIPEILEIIDDVSKAQGIDCLITLGAGSLTDGAKLVRFALANSATSAEDIDTLWGGKSVNPNQRTGIEPPTIPLICIPTSLAGGEYQHSAGATEAVSHAKRSFEPKVAPTLVIQDPELCLTTPQWVWLSSGIRAVDHCIEALCSLLSNDKADEEAAKGLRGLVPGLLRCKDNPSDLEARHLCQLGVIEAMSAVSSGIPMGASHAIGHQLGPLGVGHGHTSCILLPAVCKYNAAHGANEERQAKVSQVLLSEPAVAEVVQARGLGSPDLGDILDAVIKELGMPRTLKDVGVGSDKFDGLAKNSLHDRWIKTNPVPIIETSQVMEILKAIEG